MCFKKSIKELRKRKNLTQLELSEKLGIERGTLGSYEEGRAFPKPETLKKIIDFLKPKDLYKFLFG